MVYTTQHYQHDIEDKEKERIFEEQMTAKGFIKATPEILSEVVNTKRKFFVVVNGTDFFGSDVNKLKEDKMLLKDWGEHGGLHWMNPRAKRAGYKASIGQFIKEAI